MTYSEIKDELNGQTLPQTLDGEFMYYYDVKKTAKGYTTHIDECIKQGKDPRKCKECKRAKKLLILICEQLQNKDNHNKPKPTLSKFHNSNEVQKL